MDFDDEKRAMGGEHSFPTLKNFALAPFDVDLDKIWRGAGSGVEIVETDRWHLDRLAIGQHRPAALGLDAALRCCCGTAAEGDPLSR
jgi:hypothetical protein